MHRRLGPDRRRRRRRRLPDLQRQLTGQLTTSTIRVPGDRTLRLYDSADGDGGPGDLVVCWHAGTPNLGAPPAPLQDAASRLGVRWIGYDRPGYGGSSDAGDRTVAAAADDLAAVCDHLGVARLAVMGHSGGAPHALACAALMPHRVSAVAAMSGLAPYDAWGLDYLAGMVPSGAATLTAARAGRTAYELRAARAPDDEDPGFVDVDRAALEGDWAWLLEVVGPALGAPGHADDDLALAADWGFDPADVRAPTLIVHGGRDRVVPAAHGRWLAATVPAAQLWLRPDDGHVSVLAAAEDALEWLVAHAR